MKIRFAADWADATDSRGFFLILSAFIRPIRFIRGESYLSSFVSFILCALASLREIKFSGQPSQDRAPRALRHYYSKPLDVRLAFRGFAISGRPPKRDKVATRFSSTFRSPSHLLMPAITVIGSIIMDIIVQILAAGGDARRLHDDVHDNRTDDSDGGHDQMAGGAKG